MPGNFIDRHRDLVSLSQLFYIGEDMLLALAMMIVASAFWGSNIGLKSVLLFWAAFIIGNIVIYGLKIPFVAIPYSLIVCFLFCAKGKMS